jgi:hypothetical protein
MANYDSNTVLKKNKQRGVQAGRLQSVTGTIRIGTGATSQAASIATSDLLRFLVLGENVRPIRVTIATTPVVGTPVLTNPVFSVGVAPFTPSTGNTTLTRPDGTAYTAISTSATALVATLTVPAGNQIESVAVLRPVADSVSKYGPYYVTLTPITSAFSVAGGDTDVTVTVEFIGEQNSQSETYTSYVNQNVNNQT